MVSDANLGLGIAEDPKRLGGALHSMMGTATDINTVLGRLCARVANPYVG